MFLQRLATLETWTRQRGFAARVDFWLGWLLDSVLARWSLDASSQSRANGRILEPHPSRSGASRPILPDRRAATDRVVIAALR